jgi:16S rRNA processing protein RimM
VHTQDATTKYVIVGHVSKAHGIQGWVNVISYTQPVSGILEYDPWYLKFNNHWQAIKVVKSRVHAKGIMVQLENCTDRNQAEVYHGLEIAVTRDQLPTLADKDEYYWDDLLGLTVVTTTGIELGKINHIFATGSNDVLVIRGDKEHMLPYLPEDVVQKIDLAAKQMIVTWDPDF